jgi:hypothetical protein
MFTTEEQEEYNFLDMFDDQQTTPSKVKKHPRYKQIKLSPSSSNYSSDTASTLQSSFSLSPSRFSSSLSSSSDVGDLIDYSSRSGSQIYNEATQALVRSGEFLFDGNPEELSLFKELIWERATCQGWMAKGADIFNIPLTKDSGSAFTMNLLEQDGFFSFSRLREWANEMIVNKETRLAQNDYQFFWCLSNSISVRLKKEVLAHRSSYFINGTPVGILYFHIILSKMESGVASGRNEKIMLCVGKRCFKKMSKKTQGIVAFLSALAGIIALIIDPIMEALRNGPGSSTEVPPFNDSAIATPHKSDTEFKQGFKNALGIEADIIIGRHEAR